MEGRRARASEESAGGHPVLRAVVLDVVVDFHLVSRARLHLGERKLAIDALEFLEEDVDLLDLTPRPSLSPILPTRRAALAVSRAFSSHFGLFFRMAPKSASSETAIRIIGVRLVWTVSPPCLRVSSPASRRRPFRVGAFVAGAFGPGASWEPAAPPSPATPSAIRRMKWSAASASPFRAAWACFSSCRVNPGSREEASPKPLVRIWSAERPCCSLFL